MSSARRWIVITAILLLVTALRLWGLGDVPPGLSHDEVANGLIARDILSGNHALYFTAAYGHEPLYQYVQAATVALFGDHWLGLRWSSIAFGLLSIAAIYTLICHLFGPSVALLSAAWLAVSFWPLCYARVALRAISLPFTAALAAYFLFRARDQSTNLPIHQSTNALLSGLFLGLSLYTYMAARILPFIFIAFLAYAYLPLHTPTAPLHLRSSALLFLTATLISASLVVWLATHPGAEYRIMEIREPLDRLLAGDPSLVWQNLIANLKSFTIAGDPWPHQNLPGRPIFADPVSAALFYAGVAIALWRWRDPRYGFLLIWLIGALGPSVATSVAPSSIRDILGLVVVFVFPALALVEAARLIPTPYSLLPASCFLLLAPCLFLTTRDYFVRWPRNEDVRYFYQADLTAVAHRLDELPSEVPVAVAGLSVHTMDGPTLELTASRDVADVRLCDTRETLVIPASTGSEARLFVPRVVPFDEDLRQRLLAWDARAETGEAFTGYRLPGDEALQRQLKGLEITVALPDGTPVELPVSFGDRLSFLGYERLQRHPAPGESLGLLTYWRVGRPSSYPLKIFAHLLDEAGNIVAQHDGLGTPPRGWAVGDLIVQKQTLLLPAGLPPGRYSLEVGLYTPATDERLPVLTADRLLLYSFEVME